MVSSFKWFGILLVICTGCASFQNRITESTGVRDEFDAKFTVARAYEMQGNYKAAVEIYAKLISEYPEDPRIHHRLGVIAIRQGELDKATTHFDQAIKASPDDAELLTDIGYSYYLQGKFAEAEKTLRDVVATNPDNQRAANNLGIVLAKTGQGSEAYRMFRKAGSDAHAHSNLAYAYANSGHLELAQKHYSRALDYDETLTQASDALLQLDELQRDMDAGAVMYASTPMNMPEAGNNRTADFQCDDEFAASELNRVTSALHEESVSSP